MNHWASWAPSEDAIFGLHGRQCHNLLLSSFARRSGCWLLIRILLAIFVLRCLDPNWSWYSHGVQLSLRSIGVVCFIVFLKYRSAHLAVAICLAWDSALYLLRPATVYARSGQVLTVEYIKDPMIDW
jgi:hypothetical protein